MEKIRTIKKVEMYIKYKIQNDNAWAKKALISIYDNQTSVEKDLETTKTYNNKGFRKNDSKKMSGITKFYIETGFLTERQLYVVKKTIPKYWRQIYTISNKDKLMRQVNNYFNEVLTA